MWVPYYSVHFNDSQVGLRAFHLLREFSLQRQLAPPRDLITITEDWIAKKRPVDRKEAEEFDEKMQGKVGKLMEPKERAKAVMNQKATSVADIAAVLKIQEEESKATVSGRVEELEEEDGLIEEGGESQGKEAAEGNGGETQEDGQPKKDGKVITKAYLKRKEIADKKEATRAKKVAERIESLEKALSTPKRPVKIRVPANKNKGDGPVKVLWIDLQDSQYAQAWPENVRHGELETTRDHVIPGAKQEYDLDVIARANFRERKRWERKGWVKRGTAKKDMKRDLVE